MAQEQKEKTIPESMGVFEETIRNTLLSMHENIQYQLKMIKWYAERGLYYQFYYNMAVPGDEQENRMNLAKYRMDMATEGLKKLLGAEYNQGIEQKNKESEQQRKQ